MNKFTDSFQQFFGPLNPAQRTLFVGMVVAIFVFLGALFYWALKPDYALLFGSLQPEAAQEVVAQLEEQGVNYRVENDGRSIYVPNAQVHEMRMKLATVSSSRSDVQGYELFDANSLGMTDFMQQVNKKRALEGELARSINSLDQVEFSRVHLVLPERTPFQQSSVSASASVIITLKQGQKLSGDQVTGITSLIAGSVEMLDSESVTILDQAGNRLTENADNQGDFASGNLQMQLRKTTETYLTERGQSMLDRVLGNGNSILRVSAEHDFDRLVRESDLIDPDSRLIISEDRRTEANNEENLQLVPIDEFTPVAQRGESVVTSQRNQETTSQTRNYEVNKTREIFEKTQGEIKRLSASVLLNYKMGTEVNDAGEEVLVAQPYAQEEIEEFREVVRLALGMSPARGDELTITQIQFHDPTATDNYGYFTDQPTPWGDIFRWVLILATFLTIVALIMNIRKRMGEDEDTGVAVSLPAPKEKTDIEQLDLTDEEKLSLEGMSDVEIEDFVDKKLTAKSRKQLEQKAYVMEEIKDFVELKPAEAAHVIRAMMTLEDEA
ncbi:flagellar M-ring protein FliF [Rhodohalobacter sp. SW132]|uniref:flagellar basal-body MS-ring/collar protein FliF n=1 Tax=Rhodohalobacter sp. SW132 TaxID=2293433 RepID=UPI000E24EB65|nr:flagellar basal-body MS-ring/collar protein FliF [Rhodohalobacter sp. SW132]REL38684.1 flagellar M-ring protein FliF [Rhodohalobacter sp. SW132]